MQQQVEKSATAVAAEEGYKLPKAAAAVAASSMCPASSEAKKESLTLQPNAEAAPNLLTPTSQTTSPSAPIKPVLIYTPRGELDGEASRYQEQMSEVIDQVSQLHEMFQKFILNKSTGTHDEQNVHLASVNEEHEDF